MVLDEADAGQGQYHHTRSARSRAGGVKPPTTDRQDHKPRLSDLRESGSLEQDADTVMILHRPGVFDREQGDNILEVIIGKQRNGPTGEITLTYLKEYMR